MANREQSIETVNKRQIRLDKNRELQKEKEQKKLKLVDKLDFKVPECKRRHSIETNCERQLRLNKDRFYQKQKYSRELSQSHFQTTQQDYLSRFSNLESDRIEEHCWAKANITKFHKSFHYVISQCTICHEAWPLKSTPNSPYVCSQCSRDKKSPKKFSHENSMIPSSIPDELQNLTQIEEMLIA